MVDGTRRCPHAEPDICALQGRTGCCCTGDHALPVAQDHFTVGANIHQQGRCILFIKLGGQQTAYGIRTNKACNIRNDQKLGIGAVGQKRFTRQGLGFRQNRIEGNFRQIFRADPQKQLLHGRVSHHGNHADLFRKNAGIVADPLAQVCHYASDQLC